MDFEEMDFKEIVFKKKTIMDQKNIDLKEKNSNGFKGKKFKWILTILISKKQILRKRTQMDYEEMELKEIDFKQKSSKGFKRNRF